MKRASQKAMNMIDRAKIHNHMLSDAAGIHTGEEEQQEIRRFRDYLKSKNGCLVMAMEGHA